MSGFTPINRHRSGWTPVNWRPETPVIPAYSGQAQTEQSDPRLEGLSQLPSINSSDSTVNQQRPRTALQTSGAASIAKTISSSNSENTNLPPLGKIEPFIFHRENNRGHVISVERKVGTVKNPKNPKGHIYSGTTARISTMFRIDTNGYEAALNKARQALAKFNEDNNLV